MDQEAAVRTKFLALRPVLDERLSRLWAGAEADALGDGGIAIVERATGLSRTTIRAGRDELRAGVSAEDVVLVRRAGGGRPRIEDTTPEIVAVLESLVDPVTRGDPESPLRWTSKSTRKLATELTAQGYAVSPQKVGQLLAASGATACRRRRRRSKGRIIPTAMSSSRSSTIGWTCFTAVAPP